MNMIAYYIIAIIEILVVLAIVVFVIRERAKISKLKKNKGDESSSGEKIIVAPAGDSSPKFQPNVMPLSEKLLALSTDQHRFFTSILSYAMEKEGAEKHETKFYVSVIVKKKTILKLGIRRDITLASFKFENELLRDYKRNVSTSASSTIREKDTQVLVTDEEKMKTAFEMIDLMLEQHELDRKAAKERRRSKKAEKQAEAQ